MVGILTVGPVFPEERTKKLIPWTAPSPVMRKCAARGGPAIDWEMTLSQMGRGIRLVASGF